MQKLISRPNSTGTVAPHLYSKVSVLTSSPHNRSCNSSVRPFPSRHYSELADESIRKHRVGAALSEGKSSNKDNVARIHIPLPPAGRRPTKMPELLSFRESWSQWFQPTSLDVAEAALIKLSDLDHLPKDSIKSIDTEIGPKLWINELEIKGPEINGQKNKDVVLIHGYGAAKGFFYRNFNTLGTIPGYTLHALDLLGYGRSARPKFKLLTKDLKEGVELAENFFVESLEKWREERGIENFTLMAHSLGAYVGCSYAMKYPSKVDKAMFISPAGVDRTLHSIPPEMLGSADIAEATPDKFTPPKWLTWMWEKNWSPFSLVRNAGPLGPMFTSLWSYNRFSTLKQEEKEALHLYTYAIFNARGSGEYALNYLLAPGARSRWPLSERVSGLKVPSLWVYGSHDWMNINGGHEAVRQLQKINMDAEVVELPESGHHLYHDNAPGFNELAHKFITSK